MHKQSNSRRGGSGGKKQSQPQVNIASPDPVLGSGGDSHSSDGVGGHQRDVVTEEQHQQGDTSPRLICHYGECSGGGGSGYGELYGWGAVHPAEQQLYHHHQQHYLVGGGGGHLVDSSPPPQPGQQHGALIHTLHAHGSSGSGGGKLKLRLF